MLTSIKGYYEEGQIILGEKPPLTGKTEVIVTFLAESPVDENVKARKPNEIIFGSLKGKISVPDDFDEPLADLKEYM